MEQPLLFLKSRYRPLSMYMNDIVTDNLGIAMVASLLSLIPGDGSRTILTGHPGGGDQA